MSLKLSWEVSLQIPYGVTSAAILQGHSLVAAAGTEARLWNLLNGELVSVLAGHDRETSCLAVLRDNQTLVVSDRSFVRFWDIPSREKVGEIPTGIYLTGMASSPTDDILAIGTPTSISLWETTTKTRRGLPIQTSSPSGVSFSTTGKLLAFSCGGSVELWSVKPPKLKKVLKGHARAVRAIALSPNDDVLAEGGEDLTIKIWSTKSGREIQGIKSAHSYWIYSLCFSPDGRLLASGGVDKSLKLWDWTAGSCVAEIEVTSTPDRRRRSPPEVRSISFTSDGRSLIAGIANPPILQRWEIS